MAYFGLRNFLNVLTLRFIFADPPFKFLTKNASESGNLHFEFDRFLNKGFQILKKILGFVYDKFKSDKSYTLYRGHMSSLGSYRLILLYILQY